MAKPTTFYSSILPMYTISQLVGLVPFTISKTQIKISKLKILWSLTFYTIINFYSLRTFEKSEAINDGFIAILTDNLDRLFSQSGMLFEIILALIFIKDVSLKFQNLAG